MPILDPGDDLLGRFRTRTRDPAREIPNVRVIGLLQSRVGPKKMTPPYE